MADYATLLRDHVTLTCRSVDRIFLQAYEPKSFAMAVRPSSLAADSSAGFTAACANIVGCVITLVTRRSLLEQQLGNINVGRRVVTAPYSTAVIEPAATPGLLTPRNSTVCETVSLQRAGLEPLGCDVCWSPASWRYG
jgi:hypothetical protein